MDDGWLNNAIRRLVTCLLQQFDKLPRHVGIVMDGNRRYAKLHGQSRKDGHSSGFKAMSQLLAVAYAARIPEVTVYAFSIENFNRSAEEVEDLMDIARSRLRELISNKGIAHQYGVRINIFGKLELLPRDVQQLAHDIMRATAHNTLATLNLAMPYTSRDDMTTAIAKVASETGTAHNDPSQLTVQSISDAMYTAKSHPLDLLIRTSDTHRLSDFLLWETTSDTIIDFVPELWPEYTPLKFYRSVLRWRNEVS